MFKPVGRIVSRGEIGGLFIPFKEGLPYGIYEVRDVLGELLLTRIGDSAMTQLQLESRDIDGLFHARPECCMTVEELQQVADKRLEDQMDRGEV